MRCGILTLAVALGLVGSASYALPPVPDGPEFMVNTYTTGRQGNYLRRDVSVCRDQDGDFVVVWAGHGAGFSGIGIFGRRFAADGVPEGDDFQVVAATSGDLETPSVACAPDGDFVVAWTNDGVDGVEARVFDDSGAPVTGEIAVEAGFANLPGVASDADGNFVVVWDGEELGSYGIRARRFDSAGTPLGASFRVNDVLGYTFKPAIAMNGDGDFVVTWEQGGDLLARRYDATGAPVGAELQVNQSFFYYDADVAMDADGDFVVVWHNHDDMMARRFQADTTPVANEFVVASLDYGFVYNPVVAANPAGAFVVAWEDLPYDSEYVLDENEMFARAFDPSGNPRGPAFMVNTSTIDYQQYGDVAMDPSGNFVVVWADRYGGGTFDADVFGQRFLQPVNETDTGVAGKKLVIVDKLATADKAKVVWVAKDPAVDKGAGGDPADLDGDFRVFYTDQPSSVVGTFVLPSPWRTHKDSVAKYVNSTAPAGTGDVKVGVLKTGVVAKVVAKGLGDGSAIDVFGGPPSASGGLTAVLTLRNAADESVRRFCTRFAESDGSTMVYKELAGGLGRKIVAKDGVPAPCP